MLRTEIIETYRYLFRNIPLKRISIMFSISALFSCSFMRKGRGQIRHHMCPLLSFMKGHFSYLCDLPLYLLKLQWAFLSRCLCLLHIIQFLTVFNADMQAQIHTSKSTHQLQCWSRVSKIPISLMNAVKCQHMFSDLPASVQVCLKARIGELDSSVSSDMRVFIR